MRVEQRARSEIIASTALAVLDIPTNGDDESSTPELPFDWAKSNAVVAWAKPSLAIYENERRQIVMRTDADDEFTMEDPYLIIDPRDAETIAGRLLELARAIEARAA